MHETLKNVCTFCVFLMTVIFIYCLHPTLEQWFQFSHGKTALMLFLAVLYVIVFHVLFYYLGKQSYKTVYIVSGTVFAVLAGLIYGGIITLP